MERDTRTRLLDAAERLFSEAGIGPTSLRAITAEAEANLAAVNYHFGSKDELIRAVLDRRLRPLNEERLRRLEMCDALDPADPGTLREILRALVVPVVRLLEDSREAGHRFPLLLGRAHFETYPGLQNLVAESFREIVERFSAALQRCLPHLSNDEVVARMMFSVGVVSVLANMNIYGQLAGDNECLSGADRISGEMVGFIAAGFAAPGVAADVADLEMGARR